MAYQNDKYQSNRGKGGYNSNYPKREVPKPAGPFSEEYVDFAENLMRTNTRNITTSKLRNILSLLMDAYNTESLRTADTITEEDAVRLQMARIRLAYECGRDNKTKQFVEAANLLPWLKEIGTSRDKLLHYVHYVEALVAYHRFFGGREN